jgi:hypothetical protein
VEAADELELERIPVVRWDAVPGERVDPPDSDVHVLRIAWVGSRLFGHLTVG